MDCAWTLPGGQNDAYRSQKAVETQDHLGNVGYFVAGTGRMWRQLGEQEEVVELNPGVSFSIALGSRFQFRCDGTNPLSAIGVTMPPWAGEDEAVFVNGPWA